MKILQVIPFLSPKFGGTVTVISQLSKELAQRGHDVTILTSDHGFDEIHVKEIEGLGVRVVPLKTLLNFGLFIYTPSIKQWLKDNGEDFEIIHMHNFRAYQNNCVFKHAKDNNIPYILQAHGSVLPVFQKEYLKKFYDLVWGYAILSNASKNIAVSKTERDQYIKMHIPESSIEIVPNGIDIPEFSHLPEQGQFRKKYGISPEEKIILYLGRLHKSKGIDYLVDGASSLIGTGSRKKLVIVGSDEGFLESLKDQIERLQISENVIITGALYQTEKLEALVDADVLVYPGPIEIFGLVPFEAIMCGTPVIVSRGCGGGEMIEEAGCGYLVKYGDTDELKERIETLLRDPGEAEAMVRNGQAYIKGHLQWQTLGSTFLKIYEDCIRNG